MNDLISSTIAAAMIGCHFSTLHNWRQAQKGPPVVTIEGSTALAYSRNEVLKWIEENKKQMAKKA